MFGRSLCESLGASRLRRDRDRRANGRGGRRAPRPLARRSRSRRGRDAPNDPHRDPTYMERDLRRRQARPARPRAGGARPVAGRRTAREERRRRPADGRASRARPRPRDPLFRLVPQRGRHWRGFRLLVPRKRDDGGHAQGDRRAHAGGDFCDERPGRRSRVRLLRHRRAARWAASGRPRHDRRRPSSPGRPSTCTIFSTHPINIELLETLESLGVNLAQTEADRKPEMAGKVRWPGMTISVYRHPLENHPGKRRSTGSRR